MRCSIDFPSTKPSSVIPGCCTGDHIDGLRVFFVTETVDERDAFDFALKRPLATQFPAVAITYPLLVYFAVISFDAKGACFRYFARI
jgi:hypothetical protein